LPFFFTELVVFTLPHLLNYTVNSIEKLAQMGKY